MKIFVCLWCCGLSLILGSDALFAQYTFPSLSPPALVQQTVGNTIINIEYERPAARGRVILGNLVPWDKVWRTGAGFCTRISFSESVRVGGQAVAAGKYSIFTIPGKTDWMVILNRDTTLYGAYDYQAALDVARFTVPFEESGRYYESLTFDIDFVPNDAVIYLSWTDWQISFPVETQTQEAFRQYIETELLTGQEKEASNYANAADYLLFQNEEYLLALELTDKALALEKSGFAYRVKMEAYAKMRRDELALAVAEAALEWESQRSMDSFESAAARDVEMGYWKERIAKMKTQLKP